MELPVSGEKRFPGRRYSGSSVNRFRQRKKSSSEEGEMSREYNKKPASPIPITSSSSDDEDGRFEINQRKRSRDTGTSRIPLPVGHKASALSSGGSGSSGYPLRRSKRTKRRPKSREGTKHHGESTRQEIMESLERLIRCHPIWFLPGVSREEASSLLNGKEVGSFIVRKSSQPGTMAISVRQFSDPNVEHYLIENAERSKLKLESSDHEFENILSLVYHYSTVKEELPHLLILPQTLREVESRQNLSSLSLLGKDFWRYPMSFPDSKRNSILILNQDRPLPSESEKPKRKPSVFEGKFDPQSHLGVNSEGEVRSNLLDETLFGLQEVSDMLQASLKELEQTVTKNESCCPTRPPPPPVRTSSHLASPVSSPGARRRLSDSEVISRPHTPLACSRPTSPKSRPTSSRHSVCRMVVTRISEARFPVSKSQDLMDQRILSTSPDVQQTSPMSTRSQERKDSFHKEVTEKPIQVTESKTVHVNHSILQDHILPRFGYETKGSYYRSSVADKMSDYEDIWCDQSTRSITPAESETQFKAYLASKLHPKDIDGQMPFNNNNNHEKDPLNTVSSSISSSSTSNCSITSSKISASIASSKTPGSTISSSSSHSNLSQKEISNERPLGSPASLSSSEESSNNQENIHEDPVYSDPLDALEKAEDTRIYNFPESDDNEIKKDNVGTKLNHSTLEDDEIISDSETEAEKAAIDHVEVLVEDIAARVGVDWKQPGSSLNRSSNSEEKLNESDHSSLLSAQSPLSRVRKTTWSSPSSTAQSRTSGNNCPDKNEVLKQRKISSPPVLLNRKDSSPGRRSKLMENRLSAVIGKYIRPVTSQGAHKRTSWQVDSSSWEFLNEQFTDAKDDETSLVLTEESHLPIQEEPQSSEPTLAEEPDLIDTGCKEEESITEPNTSPMSSRDRIQCYIRTLSLDHSSLFGQNVEHFLTCTLESREKRPCVVMRNIRQFMTGLKNYLTRSGEGELWNIVEEERNQLSVDEFLNLDAILEEVLHDLVIRPLKDHLAKLFRTDFESSGCIELLLHQMEKLKAEMSKTGEKDISRDFPALNLEEVTHLCRGDFDAIENCFSPVDKLSHLLKALKMIVQKTGASQGSLNVEKFCFLLAAVLARCATERIEIESEFMWGLLPRPLLSGEAGYYLTLLSSSIHFLKTFQGHEQQIEEEIPLPTNSLQLPDASSSLDSKRSKKSTLSSFQTTNSLSSQTSRSFSRHQECGRTILEVLIPDEITGSILKKSLPVKAGMTAKEVRKFVAHKMKITNDEDYALFKLDHGKESLLPDSSHPSEIGDVIIVYRRQEAKIVWPTKIS